MLNTDKAPTYAAAIAQLKREGRCPPETEHRQVKYLNNVLEADHGKLTRLCSASDCWDRELEAAEADHLIRWRGARRVGAAEEGLHHQTLDVQVASRPNFEVVGGETGDGKHDPQRFRMVAIRRDPFDIVGRVAVRGAAADAFEQALDVIETKQIRAVETGNP